MKPGQRALGVAFSDADAVSTCAGAVVRGDRTVDGLAFERCTVGGDDATDAVVALVGRIDRPDVSVLLLAGVAPAWFNVLDLPRLHEGTGLPTIAISFEASPGLAPAIREEFDGAARDWRLDVYESLPPRRSLTVNDEQVFVRGVGVETPVAESGDADGADVPPLAPNCEAAQFVRGFTPEGGRPEPLRVARLAARAGRELGERLDS
ncbi:DUF99 family protein [Halolamina sp. CBA1230]|uniref:endonuclease dU n=1 Tax=Halolamina sp. CBA1230 TaxID=1853690 RepID=UPI0009A2536B|nr:DUF99 family protein [Halolamina sp. CBA1230]QKY21716.1 DUF99 family protein [Halolamina sp. CBA1230]